MAVSDDTAGFKLIKLGPGDGLMLAAPACKVGKITQPPEKPRLFDPYLIGDNLRAKCIGAGCICDRCVIAQCGVDLNSKPAPNRWKLARARGPESVQRRTSQRSS